MVTQTQGNASPHTNTVNEFHSAESCDAGTFVVNKSATRKSSLLASMPASPCKLLPYLIPALCILDIRPIHGQPGSLDPSFDPGSRISKNGTARVSSIALQNDGKILIAGTSQL